MKFLKRTALVLAVLFVIYMIVALCCKPEIHVERSMQINAAPKVIFDQVNSLKNWQNWSYWDNIDKAGMNSTFEGPDAGVGAKHSWDSKNDSVGKGSLTITKSEPNTFVETELYFEGHGKSMGGWRIKDSAGVSTVTTYMDMKPPFLFRPMMLFMNMDKMLGDDFIKSLEGLKKVSESSPNTSEMKIEATTVDPMKILVIKDSCTSAEISMKLGALYGEIGQEMKKAGAKQAGAPFAIYYSETTNADGNMKFVFEAGVQVDKEVKPSGRVVYRETTGGKVVKGDFYGNYSELSKGHEQISDWMAKNGKVRNGPPWESYVTDPMTEKDPDKWLTEIYYPIE